MGHKFHRGFTAAEKTELWDRWKRGESLKAIGRAFGKQSSSIYFLVAPHGGIRRILPARPASNAARSKSQAAHYAGQTLPALRDPDELGEVGCANPLVLPRLHQ